MVIFGRYLLPAGCFVVYLAEWKGRCVKKGAEKEMFIGGNQMNQSKLIEDDPIWPNDIDSGCNCFSSQLYDRVIYYTELHEDKNRKGKGAQIMLTLFWLKFIPKFRDGLRYLMIFWSLKTLTTPQFRLQKFNLISTPENAYFHRCFINGAAPRGPLAPSLEVLAVCLKVLWRWV